MKNMYKKWNSFDLITLFDMSSGKYLSKDSYNTGDTPLVSATNLNNGIKNYVDLHASFKAGSITIGKVSASTFYQEIPFCATGDVTVLYPKFQMSKEIGLFIKTLLNLEEKKWCYGRQIRLGDCKKLKIMLPTDNNNNPDWIFIEKYMKELTSLNILKVSKPVNKVNLLLPKVEEWKHFKLNNLFELSLATPYHKNNLKLVDNGLPYITRSAFNNGISGFVDFDTHDLKIEHGNVLSIGAEGCTSFYHDYNFICGNKITILKNNNINKFNALFLKNILDLEMQKVFSYGRAATYGRLKELSIRLPVDLEGQPNWNLMELYIKSLPYSEYI